ncbi:peptidylprolyl isomerase [uncultured Caulobacter sp.]|uniref:peptidylprolyl isomerase n=1 Tax=uncultured Caulobacter sp. TaxID=158749 RepID=UPI002635DCEF|nr:peptidylprolyl isomerase [uncultured Caulobacter sp.]
MLAGFRAFAKSPFAVLLFGLLIVSFAIFGISDVFKGPRGSGVISAGSRTLSAQDFKLRFDNYRKAMEQRNGQAITPDQAVETGIDRQIVQELTLQESMAAAIHDMGVIPSDKLVGKIVREQMSQLPPGQRPFDPITGKFDAKLYTALLGQNNLTPQTYEASLRDEIAQTHFFSAVADGLKAPRIYGAMQAAYEMEGRDIAAFAINPATIERPAAPTDAQLTAFMNENRERLTRPETRVLSIMRISAKALEPSVTPDPAAIQKAFDFRKDSLAKPETRSLIQIVAPDAKAAATISQRLAKGEDPAEVAKAFGRSPVALVDKPKSAVPDRKVADAAFGLAAGQVSGPINGELGISVIKITKITPGVTATLASVRPQIEAEVRAQAAQSKAYDQTQTYQDAHDGGADLVAAATKAGALVQTTAPITAQGADQTGQPVPGLTPDMVKTAFGLGQGAESDLIEAGKGEYYAVKVEKVIPAAMPPLAEIKPLLTNVWLGQEMAKRLKAKGEALAARVKKGETMDAVAASTQSKVQRVAGLSRQNMQQHMGLGREFLGAAFQAKPGEVFTARAGQQGEAFVVAKLEAVRAAPTAGVAQIAVLAQGQVGNGLMRDLGEASRAAAKVQLKTKSNLTLARQAIGVDTEALAKAQAAKGGKKAE